MAEGPEKRKGAMTPREAAEREIPTRQGAGTWDADADPREEEGYDQPESSAQKGPERPHREDD